MFDLDFIKHKTYYTNICRYCLFFKDKVTNFGLSDFFKSYMLFVVVQVADVPRLCGATIFWELMTVFRCSVSKLYFSSVAC